MQIFWIVAEHFRHPVFCSALSTPNPNAHTERHRPTRPTNFGDHVCGIPILGGWRPRLRASIWKSGLGGVVPSENGDSGGFGGKVSFLRNSREEFKSVFRGFRQTPPQRTRSTLICALSFLQTDCPLPIASKSCQMDLGSHPAAS